MVLTTQEQKNKKTSALTELARPVNIPPRPALLVALQHELGKDNPHIGRIAQLVARDVAIAGNFMALANSAMFSPGHRIATVSDAITVIGLNNCAALSMRLMARRALTNGRRMLPRFWDVSEKRSRGMLFIARRTRVVTPDLAYQMGLFSDIGIPLMMASFPDYGQTLAIANRLESSGFIELENERHRINHARVGAMLAEHWRSDALVVQAILHHHEHHVLADDTYPGKVRHLIAIFFLVDKAIQEHRNEISVEWREGGAAASALLDLTPADIDEACTELQILFNTAGTT